MEYVTLNNGVKMPILGLGVYQIDDLKECENSILTAISLGYRSIDTAQAYYNEEAVGNAIKKCGIPRKDLFITTKIWITNGGYEKAKISINESLKKLKTDYVDLMLIHQPFNDYYGTYRAMEEAYKDGKIRAIGVSNFYPDRLIDLLNFVEIKPTINQIETHVFFQQKKAHEIMNKYNIQHESWGPFAEGRNNFFTNPILVEIGAKYKKTAAQIALRYLIQNNIVVIPKTIKKERMKENMDIFDFKLVHDDMQKISELDTNFSLFFSHSDPEKVESIISWSK